MLSCALFTSYNSTSIGVLMENQEAQVLFNFAAVPHELRPASLPENLQCRAGFAPSAGDVISFEGTDTVFFIHNRQFKVRKSGIADVQVNLIPAKPIA